MLTSDLLRARSKWKMKREHTGNCCLPFSLSLSSAPQLHETVDDTMNGNRVAATPLSLMLSTRQRRVKCYAMLLPLLLNRKKFHLEMGRTRQFRTSNNCFYASNVHSEAIKNYRLEAQERIDYYISLRQINCAAAAAAAEHTGRLMDIALGRFHSS
jgi:hypothetical protein